MPDTVVSGLGASLSRPAGVVALADGGHVVIWSVSGSGDQDIYSQRYDSAGVTVGGRNLVNSFTIGLQTDARVASLSNGGYAVIWLSSAPAHPGTSELYGRFYDAAGATSGADIRLTTSAAGNTPTLDSVSGMANGDILVVTRNFSNDPATAGHFAQIYDASGAAHGPAIQVNTSTSIAVWETGAGLADGGYVVVESHLFDGVTATVFNANGSVRHAEYVIDADTLHLNRLNETSVTALAGGGFAVSWSTGDNFNADVYARVYDQNGAAVSSATPINTTSSAQEFVASTFALADGGFMATWTSYAGASVYRLYAQRFDAVGAALADPFIVSEEQQNGEQTGARGHQLADGSIVFAWTVSDDIVFETRFDMQTGNGLNNSLTVGSGRALLYGLDGGDTLRGGSGSDVLQGGDGADSLIGAGGYYDTLYGGAGDDTLQGGEGANTLAGGAGLDTASYADATAGVRVTLSTPHLTFVGTPVPDTLSSIENLTGSDFADALKGDSGANVLIGGAGADELYGESGNDTLYGGDGEDNLWAGLDDDLLYGGDGVDTVNYSNIGPGSEFGLGVGVTLNLGLTTPQNTGGAGTDTLLSIGSVVGTHYGDTLTGDGGNNVILGVGGDDLISGGAGFDYLDGGQGRDTVSYASATTQIRASLAVTTAQNTGVGLHTLLNFENLTGSDYDDSLTGNADANILIGGGSADMLAGGAGADSLYGGAVGDTLDGGVGDDLLDGGDNVDTASYASATAAVRVSLSATVSQDTSGAGTDLLASIENLIGSAFADTLTGDIGANALFGGAGDDTLDGGAGNDSLDGGAGIDTASYASSLAAMRVNLGTVGVQFTLGAGNDTLVGIENAIGSAFNDSLQGSADANVLVGAAGDDNLSGSGGGDSLYGGDGDDQLFGDTFPAVGDDVLDGGAGRDTANYSMRSAGAADPARGVMVSLAIAGAQNTLGAGIDTLVSIENILGTIANDTLTGDSGDNNLIGIDGDDVLEGGAGNDSLAGANGVDVASYAGAATGVAVDLRIATAQNTLGAGTDTLVQIENLTGSSFSDTLTGDAGGNMLVGLAGNDLLDGGAGADSLYGGLGDDSFVVDQQGDLVFEAAGEGTDSVTTTGDYYLYANIENLVLASGAGAILGVGNDLANGLTGNAGANTLLGGLGDDTVNGGDGADRLFGEGGTDVLNGQGGDDYLVGGDGSDLMDGGEGADALYGQDGIDMLIGGAGVDTLVGGAGNDALNGASGAGEQDLMDGGDGNDDYLVDAANDLTFEAGGGGTDTVTVSMGAGGGYYLYANVENMLLIGQTAYGVGNELANVITGNEFGNWLLGGGGDDTLNGKVGNDVLFGQGGADTFVFQRGTGGDVIGDFQVGVDKIQLTGIYTSFDQVHNSLHQNGSDTAIDLGQGDFVVVNGVAAAAFTAADFVF